jgi:hypothetical protein
MTPTDAAKIAALQLSLDDAAKLLGEQRKRIAVLEELLDRCAEFLDGYSDVNDGDYGVPEPNAAMRLLSAINEELT